MINNNNKLDYEEVYPVKKNRWPTIIVSGIVIACILALILAITIKIIIIIIGV